MNARGADQNEETSDNKLVLTWRFLKIYWKIVFAVSWAALLAPFIFIYNIPEVRCAYTVLLMAGYWILECFPTAVTALLPVVLYPMLGVLSTAETCSCYMNDTIMVFIGGLILAVAVEHSNLHLRIALGVMKTVGCSHGKLLGGLCVVTTFISMWVSNTAATAMMVPIIFAVLNELEQAGFCKVFDTMPVDPEKPGEEPEQQPTNVTTGYLLAAAYCSTFGGTGTLVGTGTNLTFKGIFENTFPGAEGINFSQWMVANMPQMAINSFLTWIYLRIAYMGYLRPNSKDAQLATIGEEGYTRKIQGIGQYYVSRVVCCRPFCIMRHALDIPKARLCPWVVRGNNEYVKYLSLSFIIFSTFNILLRFTIRFEIYAHTHTHTLATCLMSPVIKLTNRDSINRTIQDSTPVILVSILMFFIPKDPSFIYNYSSDHAKRPTNSSEGLITWDVIQRKMPWSLMFLLGGGFAISKGSIASCLAKRIGNSLVPLRYLPPQLILLFVSLFIGTITEFTSNVGIANITLPIVAQMCVAMKIHPMYLMVPATIMCSYSFRLPVGTPPNAIVSIVGRIPTKSMMIGGCGPAIFSLFVQSICFITWGNWVYSIGDFPEWASEAHDSGANSTCD